MSKPDQYVTMERVVNAHSDDLYAAWTDAGVMAAWMNADVAADARVGGELVIRAESEDGEVFVHGGRYLALEPGTRIAFSFRAGGVEELDEPLPISDEYIEIRLQPLGPAQTLLRFVNGWKGQVMDDEALEAIKAGWSAWLDQLELLF